MTKSELESKSLSELHSLAAEAGVPRYRMLARPELIEALADGGDRGGERSSRSRSRSGGADRERSGSARGESERPQRRRRRSGGGGSGERERSRRERPEAERPGREGGGRRPRPQPRQPESGPAPEAAAPGPGAEPAQPRRRRRRRFRRRKDEVTIQDLLLPPESGRQAILCAESREACTAQLRGVAADLAKESKGPDPVVLLIDPSPEELAEWKRDAPDAEIVAAGQARHAADALAQASARANGGEDVILLVDSLTRLGSAYGEADAAKEFFDAGRTQGGAGGGSLTVVAALQRPSS
jgi:transcription termination factor Rho